jgi:hypothetical protein
VFSIVKSLIRFTKVSLSAFIQLHLLLYFVSANCISCILKRVRIIRAVIDDGHVYGEQAFTVTKRSAPAEAI